jgi:hypothetical protein
VFEACQARIDAIVARLELDVVVAELADGEAIDEPARTPFS